MTATLLRNYVLDATLQLVTEECCNCSVVFAMPKDLRDRRVKDHEWFYCPNGHSQHYTGPTPEQKLRKQLLEEQDRSSRLVASVTAARDQARAAELSARAQKGHATRLRKRAAAGVCPCCTRTFQNLARHMAGQHPGFGET